MSTELAVTDDNGDVDDRILRIIWRNVGVKPIREIAELTGLPPERVMRIRQELRDSIDAISVAEKQFKILTELEAVMNDVRDKIDKVQDERNYAGIVNSFINATKTLNVELRAIEKKNDTAVQSLNALRVRELLNLVNATVVAGVAEIAETHGLDEGDLLEVFNRHLNGEAEKRDNL